MRAISQDVLRRRCPRRRTLVGVCRGVAGRKVHHKRRQARPMGTGGVSMRRVSPSRLARRCPTRSDSSGGRAVGSVGLGPARGGLACPARICFLEGRLGSRAIFARAARATPFVGRGVGCRRLGIAISRSIRLGFRGLRFLRRHIRGR